MNMCPTNKCKSTPESCLKGQVFFILTNCSNQEILKTRISLLGGKVEEFLSKDVTTLLVEDNQLIGQELLPDLSVKTTYNTVNGTIVASFPYPGSLSNIPSTSRGYNFLATNTSSKYSPYRLICYARQYNIQVLGIAQFLTWTEPQIKVIRQKQPRKASENVSNLSGYFIKFETVNKNYRPCYKMFNNDPDRLVPLKNASVLVKPEACNIILNKPVVVTKHIQFTHMDPIVRPTHQGKGANLPVKVNEKKPQNNRARPKEDNNYCECCKTHFADFKQHIKSSKHQSFVSNDKNYESVHNILKMLPTAQEFIESLQKPSPDSDPALTNGDNSATIPVANIPETDYSVPLNLEVRRENAAGTTVQVSTPIGKNNNGSNLQVKKEEVMPLPLDLHIKRNDEIKVEIKQETNLCDNCEEVGLHKKEEINLLQLKQEPVNEVIMGNIKIDDKQPNELLDAIQCDESNGGDFFDKTNTAALAQLCLKNFDSYWLDSLPCEVEDMEFDDIFAFDDGKAKVDDEGFEPFVDNIVNSEVPQTPGLVSGISNSNLKTDNTSIFMNTSVDVKDFIKTEPSNQESFLSTCKLGKENETSVSPLNIPVSFNDSLSLENKKPIFSIASFCSDKIGIEATPSCSNTIPSKNLEQLFSDESSDDENGNVLISNALNFITNSDNEGKVDKESSEDNSLEEKFKVNTLFKKGGTGSGSKSNQLKAVKNNLGSNQIELQFSCKESSTVMPNPTVIERNMPVKNSQVNNCMSNSNADRGKVSFQNVEELSKVGSSFPEDIKHQNKRSAKKSKVGSNKECKSIIVGKENSTANKAKKESISVTNVDTQKSASSASVHHTNELLSSNIKNDPENHKESNSQEKEWDYTCNKIYKKYPVPLNRSLDSTKVLNEKSPSKGKETSASLQSKHFEETKLNQKSSEKYPNPKKNISMREMAVKQNNSEVSSSVHVSVSEGVNQSSYPTTSTPVKNASSKEMNSNKTEKNNELNIDKKEKVNITPVKTVPHERKVDQISFKPYISDENDRKVSLERRQNIERNVQSNAYTGDLSKPTVYENRIGQNNYMDINPVKNNPHKQELFYSSKTNFNTSTNADIHDLSSLNKGIGSVNSLSLEKSENVSSREVDPSIKNFEREAVITSATVNCPNVSATSINSTSLENRVNYMNYKFMTHQNVSPDGKVHKNISQITETDTSHSTLDLSCLSLKSVPNISKTSKPYCDVKSAHLPEGKVPKEKKDKLEIKSTVNVSNAKIVPVNQSSGDNRGLTVEKHPKKVNSANLSTATDKSIKSVNFPQCQNEVKLNVCDVTSVKTPYFPEEKIANKEKHNPPENVSLNIPHTSGISTNQSLWKNTQSTISCNVSAPVKNLISQGEEMSHQEDNVDTDICLNLSTSKTADRSIHEKAPKRCGDFTSIENLISRDKSPSELKYNHEQQMCSHSSKVSNESRSQVSGESNLSQHPSNVTVTVKTPLQSEEHSDIARHNSETKVSSKAPKLAVVSEKQASAVGIQNQISCDAPKNLQSHEESNKKRTSIQTSVKLSISNTSVSGKGNYVNQSDGLSKKTILKQDTVSRKRKEHPEAANSSNTNFSSANVSYSEKKDHCTNYEYFVPFKRKKVHRKEKKVRKKMKHNPVSVNKRSVSEISSTRQPSRSSANPCQYSYRTAKYNMDTSSSALPVKSSMVKQTLKLPHHKKQSSRRIELPPLWTVSVSGVKLKFTRVYPKKVDTYQYVTEDDSD